MFWLLFLLLSSWLLPGAPINAQLRLPFPLESESPIYMYLSMQHRRGRSSMMMMIWDSGRDDAVTVASPQRPRHACKPRWKRCGGVPLE